jgi:hypothetical protein
MNEIDNVSNHTFTLVWMKESLVIINQASPWPPSNLTRTPDIQGPDRNTIQTECWVLDIILMLNDNTKYTSKQLANLSLFQRLPKEISQQQWRQIPFPLTSMSSFEAVAGIC